MKQVAFGFDRVGESAKRDAALDLFETYRGDLLEAARLVADELATRNGRVTAPEVLATLRERGFSEVLDGVDRRFMGGVFRSGSGWKRVGWENGGSHRRPVSIWVRKVEKTA